MKANEAPENMYIPKKIYLPYKDGKIIGLVKDDGLPFSSGDGNIEYTRTDAFIEKATLWLLTNASDYCILHNSYDTKELIEDFIKAMKRE